MPTLALALALLAPPARLAAQPAADSTPARGLPFAVPGAPRPPGYGRPAPKPNPVPATLGDVLASVPADSLDVALRRFEADHGRSPEGAEAAFTLGQLHYARGEYRQAVESFARAAARYAPARKPEARYWQGLAALGLGDAVQARAALEELARGESPRRAAARFALAETWLRAGRNDRALEELEGLLADRPMEMETSALERLAELKERAGDADGARRAREQLQKLNPAAVEPVRRPSPPPAPPVAVPARGERGRIAVQIGAFSDPERARTLQEGAKRAGFERTQMSAQGSGGARLYVVRIGVFENETAARAAGEHASRELGVAYRLIRNP